MWEEVIIAVVSVSSVLVLVVLAKMLSMQKAMAEMKTQFDVTSASVSASVSTPANMLTSVANTLQQNAMNLSGSIAEVNKFIGDIGQQATKIETLGKKYEATEELTRRMYNIMIGSYEKGKSGENTLKSMMNELMKIGLVRQNVPVGTKVVEYGVIFKDGKILAIDSKVVATQDIETLLDENTPEQDREILRKKIKTSVASKMNDVCKYIDPSSTLPCAVMAIPDSVVSLTNEVIPEAVSKNVMIAGYSAVPQLIVYFVRIHGFYSIKEDVAELKERLLTIQQATAKLDDKFFANRFDKPIGMLNKATMEVRQTLGKIDDTLSIEHKATPELTDES
jgi:hypothetical protein